MTSLAILIALIPAFVLHRPSIMRYRMSSYIQTMSMVNIITTSHCSFLERPSITRSLHSRCVFNVIEQISSLVDERRSLVGAKCRYRMFEHLRCSSWMCHYRRGISAWKSTDLRAHSSHRSQSRASGCARAVKDAMCVKDTVAHRLLWQMPEACQVKLASCRSAARIAVDWEYRACTRRSHISTIGLWRIFRWSNRAENVLWRSLSHFDCDVCVVCVKFSLSRFCSVISSPPSLPPKSKEKSHRI